MENIAQFEEQLNRLTDTIVMVAKQRNNFFDNITNWKRIHYKQLSDTISADLLKQHPHLPETQVSESTLIRLFIYRNHFAKKIDGRVLKTLDKLSLYCGFKNWADFLKSGQKEAFTKQEEADINEADKLQVLELVNNANKKSLQMHFELPFIDTTEFRDYFTADSPAFSRLTTFHERIRDKGYTIKNAQTNSSSFEMVEVKLKQINTDFIQVFTKEFWMLQFDELDTDKPVIFKNDISEQIYFITRTPNGWRINNHYNSIIIMAE
jgi:hypothetical protein